MADIFISYANSDRDRIIPIVRVLEKEGWSVWWDRRIPAGKTFDEVIEKEIDVAKCVLVVWTKDSVVSRWVKAEAAEGAQREILIPVLLDDVKIPFEFRRIQAAELINWRGDVNDEGFSDLLVSLAAILRNPVNVTRLQGQEARKLENKADAFPASDPLVLEQHKVIDQAANILNISPAVEPQEQNSAALSGSPPVLGSDAQSDLSTARNLGGTHKIRALLSRFAQKKSNGLLVIALVFLLLILFTGSFYVYRDREIEPIRRGRILDRSGRTLALNQADSTGHTVRNYPLDEAVSHLLGSERGEPRLERTIFASSMTDVRLSIDSELQQEAVEQLRGRHGAVVVLNPQTGELLAMYSNPSYSLREVQDEETWVRLNANKRDRPLVSRALNIHYMPSYAFETVIMLAAFNHGLQHEKFNCSGAGFYAERGAAPIFDSGGPDEVHGNIDLDAALEVSCNQYFAQLAIKLGPERLAETMRLVGITPYPNIEQATSGRGQPQIWNTSRAAINYALAPLEATVVLYPKMRPYDLGLIGVGQGYAGQMTPFQMALVAATVGNLEGKLMKPKIEYDRPPEAWAQASTPQHAAEMRRIMGLVTAGSSGTATSVLAPVHAQGIITGGKTGTAEKQIPLYHPKTGEPVMEKRIEHDLHGNLIREYMVPKLDPDARIDGWFLCIAPLNNPQIAIAVIIEGGGFGAKSAAPVAAALVMKARELKLL